MDGDLSVSTKGTCVSQDVVLIGPIGVGKSTQGRLLSEALSLPQCSMDQYRWDYYREIGYDEEFDQRLGAHVGFWGRYLYWKEFECHAVERLLSEHRDCVIDLGGGHSVYGIDTHFSRVRSALEPAPDLGQAEEGAGALGGGRPEWGGLIGWRAQSSECEPWPHRTTDPNLRSLLPSLNRLTRSVYSLGAQKCVGCA